MINGLAKPAFVLVRPQLGENIGKSARAMLNFGQDDMRLVSPRDGWPNPSAGPSASGADDVLDKAQVMESVSDAVADCNLVFATTARSREMAKPVVTPREAALQIRELSQKGGKAAVLFGPERSGLENDDINLADAILYVPVNPVFASLNLAQAVILLAYELFELPEGIQPVQPSFDGNLADKAAIDGLMVHLIDELSMRGFFRSEGRREVQERSLYTLISNAGLAPQEVQTWRGIIKTLTSGPRSR